MSQDNSPSPLQPAQIHWQEATPVSTQFDDVYFSRDDGAAETHYVFLQQNDLPERWQQWRTPGSFTIAETGFGTGLNFFCAWALWRQFRKPQQHLHFISVEKFPLTRADFETASHLQPAFEDMCQALLAQYPPLISGAHRLHFLQESLTLTLLFDDAIDGFSSYDGRVDAWFLDGFAPSRNPQMWQPELFTQMARLSHADTTFATFTSAGNVKRGLREAGFQVAKHPGFGRKRDMLKGQFFGQPHNPPLSAQQRPWFYFNYTQPAPGHVAIIGAGLAGCSAANKLAQRGWQVTVLEQDEKIANQASGNATGITYTRLSTHNTAQNRWYISAYLYATRFIREVMTAAGLPAGEDWNLNGVLQLAFDADERAQQQQLQQSGIWSEDMVEFLDMAAVSNLLGIATEHSGLLMRNGGWVNPATLCRVLLQHANIDLRTQFKATGLERDNQQWRINGMPQAFDAVVFANTFNLLEFPQTAHLPLRWVRGQVSHVPATEQSQTLRFAINYDGYINPARHGFHCVGATFNPRDKDPQERETDHQQNLQQLGDCLPALLDALHAPNPAQLEGRVGFRCQTPDYLPLVGPLPDPMLFKASYGGLVNSHSRATFPPCPHLPGLYISTAFGAKGITGAPLAAEILASYITGEPQPLDRNVIQALHPARFLQRALKRSKGTA